MGTGKSVQERGRGVDGLDEQHVDRPVDPTSDAHFAAQRAAVTAKISAAVIASDSVPAPWWTRASIDSDINRI